MKVKNTDLSTTLNQMSHARDVSNLKVDEMRAKMCGPEQPVQCMQPRGQIKCHSPESTTMESNTRDSQWSISSKRGRVNRMTSALSDMSGKMSKLQRPNQLNTEEMENSHPSIVSLKRKLNISRDQNAELIDDLADVQAMLDQAKRGGSTKKRKKRKGFVCPSLESCPELEPCAALESCPALEQVSCQEMEKESAATADLRLCSSS